MSIPATSVPLIEDSPGDTDLVRLRTVDCRPPVEVNYLQRLADGIAAIAEQPPSVVLLDLSLPDHLGVKPFRTVLRKRALSIPVVVLSGQGNEALAVKAVRGEERHHQQATPSHHAPCRAERIEPR